MIENPTPFFFGVFFLLVSVASGGLLGYYSFRIWASGNQFIYSITSEILPGMDAIEGTIGILALIPGITGWVFIVVGWYGSFYDAPFSLITPPELLVIPLGLTLVGTVVIGLGSAVVYGKDS